MTHPTVTLVIPGRDCEATLDRCLRSVVPLKESGQLKQIIFVDDGSTDTSAEIAARYPVTVLTGGGDGPGAARNLGWRATNSDLVWFIDSDCVAQPDALDKLLPQIGDPNVGGVGGSYANLFPESLVAALIHEEIIARHRLMPTEVDFLATFNVIYRRNVLSELEGFHEELKLAQDAEFAFRVRAAGHRLRFVLHSQVGHHHPRKLWRYWKTQARQGYYRVMLYRQHPTKVRGDSYSGILDFLPPPIGLSCLAMAPTLLLADTRVNFVFVTLALLLVALHVPTTIRLIKQSGIPMMHFPWFGSVRAIARGMGLACGLVFALLDSLVALPHRFSGSAGPSDFSSLTTSEPKE